MATTYWTGTSSGAWSTAGNWTNGVPGNGDTAIFPRTATRSVSSGLDQNTIDLAVLVTEDGYAGDIGASGNPLIIGATKLKIRGSGRVYYQNSHASTEYIYLDSPNKTDALTLSGAAVFLAAVYRGQLAVVSGMSGITNLHVMYKTNPNNDAVVSVVDSTISNLWQTGGITTFGGGVGTANIDGGSWTITGATGITGTLTVSGGVAYYEATGGLANGYVLGGTLDFTTSDNVQSVGNVYVHPAGKLRYDPDLLPSLAAVVFLHEIGIGPVP